MPSIPNRPGAVQAVIAAGFIVLAVSGILFARTPREDLVNQARAKQELLGKQALRVREDLSALREMFAGAQRKKSATVFSITGSGCSDCACRDADLRNIADSSACMAAWLNVLKRLDAALGTGGAPTRYRRDPWGSPYGLDENQGESGAAGCHAPDKLRSVGKDGRWGTEDDVIVVLPLAGTCP